MLATAVNPSPSAGGGEPPKHACSVCTRRKIKCDKGDPCSNCRKTQAQCLYEAPGPRRPRKRAADDDLLTRLAIYEDLMRKNNIDFSRYAHTWVPPTPELILKGSESQSPASMISATSRAVSAACPPKNDTTEVGRCLWLNLNSELKYPPVQSLYRKDDPFLHPTPPLQFGFPDEQPELHELHPEPRYIFRLWQIFVERVHPITKIVHAPTLQQRILEASWDTSKASKSLTAIMFVIYTIAVTPMSSNDCQTSFGEAKDVLLVRYRAATVRALLKADFLRTRELEVLQAFVLFLLADPESELTSILAGAAMKLGQRMGLHRHNTDARISFFEKEMRIRLWWQLRCIDARSRAVCTPGSSPPLESEFGDVRLPLNVNDTDLHPDMVDPPIEHNSPTEMLCVLLKLEVFNWLRSSLKAAKVFDNIIHGPAGGKMSVGLEDGKQAINELEEIYHNEYIRNCDPHIPLHSMARIIARLSLARMRFKLLHPRWRAAFGGREVHFTRDEMDILFDSAVSSLELVNEGLCNQFSSHLFTLMTFRFQLDACIYMISDLRSRTSGDRVAMAWKLVEDLYNGHPELIEDADNTFFVALGDLTLEAWEARRKVLVGNRGSREFVITPQFIRLLWDKKEKENQESSVIATVSSPLNFDCLGLTDEIDLNWDYWKDFLHL
ncbi:hypothetical protein BJ170DRAFT_145692 [Xylariales sp. AK1849]|nr:hypothetical protein BJ170DRAFT_145692 [Xylariales sp. AK1849]